MKKNVLAICALTGALMGSQAAQAESYLAGFSDRVSQGFANTTMGFLEIPKNVVNITNDSNILVGSTWGLLRGAFEGTSRSLVGVAELLTSPFPIDELAAPAYPWQRFSEDSQYFGLHYPGYWTTYGPFDDGDYDDHDHAHGHRH